MLRNLRQWRQAAGAAVLVVLTLVGASSAQEAASQPASVFDLRDVPNLGARFARVQQLLSDADYAEAERQARQLVEIAPQSPMPRYHLARTLARQGEDEAAITELNRAVDRGFIGARQMAGDAHLEPLHDEPSFVAVVRRAHEARNPDEPVGNPSIVAPAAAESTAIAEGIGRVSEANTIAHLQQGVFRSYFTFEQSQLSERGPVRTDDDEVAELLNQWHEQGRAAGNHGDLYDNRDNGHSRLDADLFPQFTHIRYGKAATERELHISPQTMFLFNHVTLGNCSMAISSGPYWRSLPRLMLTQERAMAMLPLQYTQNHLYIYPSHHDYRSDRGDVYPAITPYIIISDGSSGSDKPFLRAVASTLAAFKPEVKRKLTRAGLIMPTVQMILRRSQRPVRDDEDYLSWRAHPAVFAAGDLDVMRMVEMAQEMGEQQVPPLVRLEVVEESLGELGRDYFAPMEREKVFDTPGAISRVFRSTDYTKRMVISAEGSGDLNDHPLDYEWVVLRGDGERISIEPRNEEGSVVEIEVPFHGRGRVSPGSDLATHRVDIAAFAHNGHHYSAPAFISIYMVPTERRRYSDDGRIERIDYADPHISRRYADPMLVLPKDWADEYFYDGKGRLLGWTRIRGEQRERFTREGAVVTEMDDRGRPTRARTVEYVPRSRGNNEPPMLEQRPGDTILHYSYDGPGDPLGRVERRTDADAE